MRQLTAILASLVVFGADDKLNPEQLARQEEIAEAGIEIISAVLRRDGQALQVMLPYNGSPVVKTFVEMYVKRQKRFLETRGDDQFASAAGKTLSASSQAKIRTQQNQFYGSSICFVGSLDLPKLDQLNGKDPAMIPTLGHYTRSHAGRQGRPVPVTEIRNANERLLRNYPDQGFRVWQAIREMRLSYEIFGNDQEMADALAGVNAGGLNAAIIAAQVPTSREIVIEIVDNTDLTSLGLSGRAEAHLRQVGADPRRRRFILNTSPNVEIPAVQAR